MGLPILLVGALTAALSFAASAAPTIQLELSIRLHDESGEPVLSWRCEGMAAASFDVYRAAIAEYTTDDNHLLVRGLSGDARSFFDMRTLTGEMYHYRIVARDRVGKELAASPVARVTSQRRAFTIEGKMPFVLGWSQGDDFARDLHINLLLQRPWIKGMHRLTFFDYIDEKEDGKQAEGATREERIRNAVRDPWHVGWDLFDEKEGADLERKKVDEIRKFDPFTLTMGNVMPQQAGLPIAGATEIFSVEHYSDRANWPTVILPFARESMAKHGRQWPLLPLRSLWMCFDVYSMSSAQRPTAFLKHSVYSALAHGAKGLYFFNDPGPRGFLDGPGLRLMPRNTETVGILGAEMEAWGRHLLYSEFECEAKTDTPLEGKPMSQAEWWKNIVHAAYLGKVDARTPLVQAAVQKHPRGLFLFVLPDQEIDFWTQGVRVTVPRALPAGAASYRLEADLPRVNFRRIDDQSFEVDCGEVYGAAAFVITADQSFVERLRTDLSAIQPELQRRQAALATLDQRDARACRIEDVGETWPESERKFRTALKSGPHSSVPYSPASSDVRKAEIATGESTGKNLAIGRLGARAWATSHVWTFLPNQNHSPHLAIDGKLEPPPEGKQLWGGENTAWSFVATDSDPFPVLSVQLPRAAVLDQIRLKQTGLKRIAIEFVEDKSVEFFDLPGTNTLVLADFPARRTRTLRLVPLQFADEKRSGQVQEIEVFGESKSPADFTRRPLTRDHRDTNLTTFGW